MGLFPIFNRPTPVMNKISSIIHNNFTQKKYTIRQGDKVIVASNDWYDIKKKFDRMKDKDEPLALWNGAILRDVKQPTAA